MKKWFKKIISTTLLSLFLLSPAAFAQDDNLFNPLDDIKERVGDEGIEVLDFSQGGWGNLPADVKKIMEEDSGYTDLEHLIKNVLVNAGLETDSSLFSRNLTQEEREAISTPAFVTALEEEVIRIPGLSDDGTSLNVQGANVNTALSTEIRYRGEGQISQIIVAVANVLRNLLGSLAMLWIVISGIQMIMAQGEESVITEQRKSITYAIVGLVIVLLLERMIFILYGPPTPDATVGITARGTEFSQEIYGLVTFIRTLIGSIAVLMIIISGIRMIFGVGEEDQITKQKKSVMWVLVGLGIIVINRVVIDNLYIQPIVGDENRITLTNVQRIIELLGGVAQFLLGFTGIIAFGALVYGAATMILNNGQDDLVEKGKKIAKNAVIGIVIILSAYAIVATVIRFE